MAEMRQAVPASRLPRELHETDLSLIFEKLPLQVLWQARATCRAWRNAVLEDKRMADVLKRRRSGGGATKFVQVFSRGLGRHDSNDLRSLKYALAHDPVRNAWCPYLLFLHWGFHVSKGRRVTFAGTEGGLIFFHDNYTLEMVMKEMELEVFVTNPLTNTVRELPVLHLPRSMDVEVRMVPAEDGRFRVVAVVAHCRSNVISVSVFDSVSARWSPGASFPNPSCCQVTIGPALNGSVYCYVEEYYMSRDQGWTVPIWRFNLKEDKWSQVPVPAEVMQRVVSLELVEHWGKLLMVAGSGDLREGRGTPPTIRRLDGVKVWELSIVDSETQGASSAPGGTSSDADSVASSFVETTYAWKLVGEMQHPFRKQFLRKFQDHWFPSYGMSRLKVFDLVAVDHCIYLSIDCKSSGTGEAGRCKDVALFDTLDRSWSWVAPSDLVLPYSYTPFCMPMSFVPKKAAMP